MNRFKKNSFQSGGGLSGDQAAEALSIYVIAVFIAIPTLSIMLEFSEGVDFHTLRWLIINWGSALLIGVWFFFMMRLLPISMRDFGFQLKRPARYIGESLAFSICFCLLLAVIKWWLIHKTQMFSFMTMFHKNTDASLHLWLISGICYLIFAFVQVFITQGAILTPLICLLKIPYRNGISVITTGLVFSLFHIDFSVTFALVSIPLSMCWSFMYLRHRSLITVGLSHALIGICAFYLLDYFEILNIINQHWLVN